MKTQKFVDWMEKAGFSRDDIKLSQEMDSTFTVSAISDETQYNEVRANLITAAEHGVISQAGLVDDLLEAGPSLVVNGKPRMLHISGFIAHEGVNRNRNGFIADELREAVVGGKLFQGPHAGILDVNHNLSPAGYWYDSDFQFDPVANAWGIVAHGAIWAFRFPDIADKLIAQQVRDGNVKISMACLCKDRRYTKADDGKTVEWLHNPVFVATTVLTDAEPGDEHARSFVAEDPSKETNEDRKRKLTATAASLSSDKPEDKLMDKKELEQALAEILGDKEEAVVARLTAVFDEKVSAVVQASADKDQKVLDLQARIVELEATVADLEGSVQERDLSIQTLSEQKTGLEGRVAELETELQTHREEAETIRLSKVKDTRLAQLNETARNTLSQMPEEKRENLLTRWAQLSDDEWNERMEELNLSAKQAAPAPLFGRLPTPGQSDGIKDLDRFLRS